ncbi:MAG: LysM repeat protein [Myxococcota bacterium]|jgi:LysM repeat protein
MGIGMMRSVVIAICLLVGTPAIAAETSGLVAAEVEIRPGDNLGRIAARHGVKVEDLRRWNKKIANSDMIRVGDSLVVMLPADKAPPKKGEPWTAHYRIKPGDSLGKIASKLNVRVAELRHWNNLKAKDTIRSGRMLLYTKHGDRPPARSKGTPTKGKLELGIHLGEGVGYRLRFPKNAFTTQSVRTTLKRCTERMAKRFKGTANILIGDISRPSGGYFPPHVSHQSGRDADVGYYIKGNVQNKTMYRLKAHELNYEKNWALLRCFLIEDDVVRVFMDHRIQKAMVAWLAKGKVVDDATLDRLFEVVGSIGDAALIRHAPAHDTHVHIRFACEPGDAGCSEDPGEVVFNF